MKFHKKGLINYANADIIKSEVMQTHRIGDENMYSNLKAELTRKGITVKSVAQIWGVHENTAHNKINGVSPITIEEAFKLKAELFPDFEFTYLFAKEPKAS